MSEWNEILDKVKLLENAGYVINLRENTLNEADDFIDEIADKLKDYIRNHLMEVCEVKDVQQKPLKLYDKVHYDDGNSRNDYQIKDIDYDDCWEGIEITLEESEGEQILITKDDCSDFCTKIEDKE